MHTDKQQQQAASRQGHTPFSTTPPTTTPPQRARNGGMAASLFVRELPATICDLLLRPSTAAIEQQRRTRRQPSRQILFLLFAPKGGFVFTYSPVSG
eukprot:scaffold25724_cov153-Isochrysis_galbana.AAC.1